MEGTLVVRTRYSLKRSSRHWTIADLTSENRCLALRDIEQLELFYIVNSEPERKK